MFIVYRPHVAPSPYDGVFAVKHKRDIEQNVQAALKKLWKITMKDQYDFMLYSKSSEFIWTTSDTFLELDSLRIHAI